MLNTMTCGFVTSLFHVLHILRQLTLDKIESYPVGSDILTKGLYVYEVMTGCNSVTEVLELQLNIIQIFEF